MSNDHSYVNIGMQNFAGLTASYYVGHPERNTLWDFHFNYFDYLLSKNSEYDTHVYHFSIRNWLSRIDFNDNVAFHPYDLIELLIL